MTFLYSNSENICSRENIPVTIYSGAKEASALIAKEIATLIKKKKKLNGFDYKAGSNLEVICSIM